MNSARRGILALLLVSGIAMGMLLSFGVRASQSAREAEVAPVQCRYSQLIITARAPELP